MIWCNVIAPGTFSLLPKEEVPKKKCLVRSPLDIFTLKRKIFIYNV